MRVWLHIRIVSRSADIEAQQDKLSTLEAFSIKSRLRNIASNPYWAFKALITIVKQKFAT